MKKYLPFVFSFFSCVLSLAQIPNPGFENWTTITNDWHLTNYRQDGGEKYQPAQSGNYALKLRTLSSDDASMVISGVVPHVIEKGGFPYSQKPSKFIFYAKYDIKSGDKASIGVIFKKNGSVVSGAYTNNLYTISGSNASAYQKFEFPVSGLNVVPDSVIIIASSKDLTNDVGGSGGVTPQAGSYVIYDNLSFDTSNPIPYGDFEEWGRGSLLEPDGYIMLHANSSYCDYSNVSFPLTRTTDVHSGNYALKATTWRDPDGDDIPNIWGGTGNPFLDKQEQKFACTQKSGRFTGWYKYIPASTDTAFIVLRLYKKDGTQVGNVQKYLFAVSNYSGFSIPFDCSETPDSASVAFFTSNSQAIKNVGSTLYLDDLGLATTGQSSDWYSYYANSLPDNDGWTKNTLVTNPSTVAISALSTSNNALMITSDSTHISNYTYGSALATNTPMTLMVRAKSNTTLTTRLGGYFEFDFGPSYRSTILKLKNNANGTNYAGLSNLTTTGSSSYGIDALSWHIYRITFDGDSVRMYVDENTTPRIRAVPSATTGARNFALKFGGSSLANFSCGDVDWIAWNYAGAYAPGEGVMPACSVSPFTDVWIPVDRTEMCRIVPNPVANRMIIEGLVEHSGLRIIDLSGKSLLVTPVEIGQEIDISHLSAGVYIVKIESSGICRAIKLIKK